MKENQPQTMPVYPVQYIPNAQDEISLVDIWLTFRKHQKLFLQVAIGITLLGLVAALLMTKSYDLRTSLEIGTAIRGDAPAPIESPETLKAKLENSLSPLVENELNRDKEEPDQYKMSVSIPKKSTLLVLSSKTSKEDEEKYRELHNKVVQAASQDHARIINVLKKNIQTELSLAKIALDELRDPTTLEALTKAQAKILEDAKSDLDALSNPEIFGAKTKAAENLIQAEKNKRASLEDQSVILNRELENIGANQELIQSQIKELETQIKDAMTLRLNASQQVKSETQAMAQLMIDSEVQQNRKWLSQLKERLFITLEKKKDATRKSMEDNKRSQALQLEKIVEAEAGLKALIGKNQLGQNKLKATISKSEADMAKLINDQKRRIATQQQAVEEIQSKLDNFVETRAVVEPMMSAKPTSTPKRVILLIAMFLGGILGIVAVFIAELREKVAETVSEQQI